MLDGFGLTDYVVEGNGCAECSSRRATSCLDGRGHDRGETVAVSPDHLRGRQPGPRLIVVEDNATAARMATPLTDDNLSDTATR